MVLDAAAIARVFDREFRVTHHTALIGGASEPWYRPAGPHSTLHEVHFTRDYAASALHEAAHWCIAGARRRLLEDYGYWYCPGERTPREQLAFERVEARPQAIEWWLSAASGRGFRVSLDNLGAELAAAEARFVPQVRGALNTMLEQGSMPPRAMQLGRALVHESGAGLPQSLADCEVMLS
ncbi:MAG: elongation factor P hydroxylase [Pseudomonadota bacterium]|nr:elongation factor P hydroxylase [Pseudomonadota bacterium]